MAQARRFDEVMCRYFRKAGKGNTEEDIEIIVRADS
jgi:hypothetical protein